MFSPAQVFQYWLARVAADAELSGRLGISYKFIVRGAGGGHWVLRCRPPVALQTEDVEADCTISLSPETLTQLALGDLNPQLAYLRGDLRVEAGHTEALKLAELMVPLPNDSSPHRRP